MNSPILYTDPSGHMIANENGSEDRYCAVHYGDEPEKEEDVKDDSMANNKDKWKAYLEYQNLVKACEGGRISLCMTPSFLYPTFDQTLGISAQQYPAYIGYEVYLDPSKVDWLHAATNLIGIAGDTATFVALIDPLPVVDDLAVGGVSTGANVVGIGIDYYDAVHNNDISGSLADAALYFAQDFEKITPVLGLGAHIDGLVDAILKGRTEEQLRSRTPLP